MAFTENLDTFLADFGNTVIAKGLFCKGILEQPDEIVADGLVMSTDYELTGQTTQLGSLVFDDIISIDTENYKVRQTRKIDDGKFCIVSLNKV